MKTKNIFKNWFSRQLETKTKTNGHLETHESKKKTRDPELWRDVLAYWILGLTTEFGYVVIICAAHDILHGFYQNSNVIVVVMRFAYKFGFDISVARGA